MSLESLNGTLAIPYNQVPFVAINTPGYDTHQRVLQHARELGVPIRHVLGRLAGPPLVRQRVDDIGQAAWGTRRVAA